MTARRCQSNTNPLARGARDRRGYSLIEMLVVLALLAVVGVIAARLLTGCLATMRDVEHESTTLAAFDGAANQLREDAWCAGRLTARAGAMEISGPGANPTTKAVWEFDPDKRQLTRTIETNSEPPDITVWPGLADEITFDAEHRLARITRARGGTVVTIALPSPLASTLPSAPPIGGPR